MGEAKEWQPYIAELEAKLATAERQLATMKRWVLEGRVSVEGITVEEVEEFFGD
jgi:hypothetical protein